MIRTDAFVMSADLIKMRVLQGWNGLFRGDSGVIHYLF